MSGRGASSRSPSPEQTPRQTRSARGRVRSRSRSLGATRRRSRSSSRARTPTRRRSRTGVPVPSAVEPSQEDQQGLAPTASASPGSSAWSLVGTLSSGAEDSPTNPPRASSGTGTGTSPSSEDVAPIPQAQVQALTVKASASPSFTAGRQRNMSLFADLKTTARTDADIEASRIRVKKTDRGSGADKRKVHKHFLEGMPTDLYALRDAQDIASGKDTNNVFDMQVRANQMKEGLVQYDCLEVLTSIYQLEPGKPWDDKTKRPSIAMDPSSPKEPLSLDMFKDSAKIDLDRAKFHTELIHRFGSDDDRDSLMWGYDAIMQACDSELQLAVDKQYKPLATCHKGSVTYLYIMLSILEVHNEEQIKIVVTMSENLKLSNIKGESVQVWYDHHFPIMVFLRENNRVPLDAVETALANLATSSSPDFNSVFNQLHLKQDAELLGNPLKDMTVEEQLDAIYKTALLLYKKATLPDADNNIKWLGASNAGADSVFSASGPRPVRCYNCGEPGHVSPDCPLPKADPPNPFKPANRGGRGDGRSGRGGGRGGGRGADGGRGRGGGRGGDKYTRSGQFKRPEGNESTSGRVMHLGNQSVLMFPCNKCGWTPHRPGSAPCETYRAAMAASTPSPPTVPASVVAGSPSTDASALTSVVTDAVRDEVPRALRAALSSAKKKRDDARRAEGGGDESDVEDSLASLLSEI